MADEPPINRNSITSGPRSLAVNYDREMNKDKGPMPPFGFITEDQVNAFWGQDSQPAATGGFLEKIGFGTPAETRRTKTNSRISLMPRLSCSKPAIPR